jgi:hypothetical protein
MEEKYLSNDFFECSYKLNDFEINPYLEIKRSQLLSNILTKFIQIITHKLGVEIFSIKKNYIRTLTNMFSSWLFVQYSREDNTEDPIIPSGKMIMDTLIVTLIDMMKFDCNINKDNRMNIANEIIKELDFQKECEEALLILKKYKDSEYYHNIKKKYNIYKFMKTKKRKDSIVNLNYYQIKIQLYEKITDENISKIIRNIKVSSTVYKKLKNKYSIYSKNYKNIDIDVLLWCLLFRYITLGSHNHQLAVIPSVMDTLKSKIKLNIEVFASGINHYLDNYCSLFNDIEKYFGSLGSFFNIKPIRGLFGFNPPYENYIMEKGTERLISFLKDSESKGKPLGFLITIPVWDKEGKNIMEKEYNSKPGKNMIIEYGEFKTINMIEQSKFMKIKRMVPKNDFSYLDYFNMIYKDKTIQNTYVILLTNKYLNIDESILQNISFKFVEKKNITI